MTFDECREAIVSKAEALEELKQHYACEAEFLAECGDQPEYKAMTVLGWLGY